MKVFQKIKSLENEEKFENHLAHRVGKENVVTTEPRDVLVISEKVDGSNAQVKNVDGELLVFSHKKQLNENNTLNGFYDFVMDNKDNLLNIIPNNYSFFGEWLTPHHLSYPESAYNKWYLFDAFKFDNSTTNKGSYLGIEYIKSISNLKAIQNKENKEKYAGVMGHFSNVEGMLTVPIYTFAYSAEGLEQLDNIRQTLSNHSLLQAKDSLEEGVVITNTTKIVDIDEDTKGPLRIKCVNSAFKEVLHSSKPLEEGEKSAISWASKYITEPRVRKHILELMDENMLPQELSFTMLNDGTTKNIAEVIYEDAMSESQETPSALTVASSSYDKNVKRVKKIANKMVNKVIAVYIKTGVI